MSLTLLDLDMVPFKKKKDTMLRCVERDYVSKTISQAVVLIN